MRYFSGTATQLGTVTGLPHLNFEALGKELFLKPIALPFTQAQLLAMTPAEQGKAKRVPYITPAVFKSSPCQRITANAVHCNLIALDIDDAAEAKRLLTQRLTDALGELAFIAYHTARSTAQAPRIRVIVSAEAIPVSSYPDAVRTIASMLGLQEPTRESMVAVQPMFLPTEFEGSIESPVFAQNLEGDVFGVLDLAAPSAEAPDSPAPEDVDGPVKDISFLRAPMEGVTLADVESALTKLDPDCSMAQWIEIGAGIKHQFDSSEAFELWDQWSAKGKKYVDSDETAYRWKSLKANPEGRAPVTLRSVFKLAQARGWENPALRTQAQSAVMEWIRSESRSAEELLDQGCQRIAKISPLLGTLERKSLMLTLKTRLEEAKMPLSIADIKRSVRELEIGAAKQSGVPPWAKGMCYVTATNQFYRHTTDRRFAPEVIDLMYSTPPLGEDKPMRPRDYLMQIAEVPQVENWRYDPRQGDKRFFSDDGKPYVNTYRPSQVKAEPETAAAAGEIFHQHIKNLILEPEYQTLFIDFLAYLVQRPGEKIRWGPLLQSTPGAGKTFIACALTVVLGRRNVRKLAASNVLESQYNDWAYGSQLVVMEEVRVIGHNRHGVMDKLKPLISDDEISLSKKYDDHRTVPNVTNYLMFTNHHDSLAIQDDDRRYFVLTSPLQSPEQVEAMGGAAYFDRLFGMVRDNPGGLRSWFETWAISPAFNAEGRAPKTKYLRELADAAASPLSAAVSQTIEDEAHPLVRRDLVSLTALRGAMQFEQLKGFSDQALAAVMRELGWIKAGRHLLEGGRHSLWTKRNFFDIRQTALDRLNYL